MCAFHREFLFGNLKHLNSLACTLLLRCAAQIVRHREWSFDEAEVHDSGRSVPQWVVKYGPWHTRVRPVTCAKQAQDFKQHLQAPRDVAACFQGHVIQLGPKMCRIGVSVKRMTAARINLIV